MPRFTNQTSHSFDVWEMGKTNSDTSNCTSEWGPDSNSITITHSTNSMPRSNTNWQPTSTSASASTPTPSPSAGTDQCNESLKHSNAQKAVFHSVKGAHRLVDEGQHTEAARIAGEAGKAFLQAEGKTYDSDRSESYLHDRLIDGDDSEAANIAAGIEKAWEKIDGGQHVGGARIAVSVADHYVDGFSLPSTTE